MVKDRVAIVKPNHCAMEMSFQNLSLKTTEFGVGQMIHHRGWRERQMETEKVAFGTLSLFVNHLYVAFRSELAKTIYIKITPVVRR